MLYLTEVPYPPLQALNLALLSAGVPLLVHLPARLLLPAPGLPRQARHTQHLH